MESFYTYDPVKFHFTGIINAEEQPENSTTVVVPVCAGDKFAKWEEDKWVVKHLVDGVWVDCTDTVVLHGSLNKMETSTPAEETPAE